MTMPPPPLDALTFEDAGRTFTCTVETCRALGPGAWWWFVVSTEAHQRHAPFRAEAGDTAADVQARIVAYHEARLASRAAPPARWAPRGAVKPATPAA